MILTIISEHEQANKVIKQLEDSQDNAEKSTFSAKMNIPSDLNHIQPTPLRYGAVMKLGLIPMEGGTSSYVITSSF